MRNSEWRGRSDKGKVESHLRPSPILRRPQTTLEDKVNRHQVLFPYTLKLQLALQLILQTKISQDRKEPRRLHRPGAQHLAPADRTQRVPGAVVHKGEAYLSEEQDLAETGSPLFGGR